jgi:hypothetical protein
MRAGRGTAMASATPGAKPVRGGSARTRSQGRPRARTSPRATSPCAKRRTQAGCPCGLRRPASIACGSASQTVTRAPSARERQAEHTMPPYSSRTRAARTGPAGGGTSPEQHSAASGLTWKKLAAGTSKEIPPRVSRRKVPAGQRLHPRPSRAGPVPPAGAPRRRPRDLGHQALGERARGGKGPGHRAKAARIVPRPRAAARPGAAARRRHRRSAGRRPGPSRKNARRGDHARSWRVGQQAGGDVHHGTSVPGRVVSQERGPVGRAAEGQLDLVPVAEGPGDGTAPPRDLGEMGEAREGVRTSWRFQARCASSGAASTRTRRRRVERAGGPLRGATGEDALHLRVDPARVGARVRARTRCPGALPPRATPALPGGPPPPAGARPLISSSTPRSWASERIRPHDLAVPS